MTIELHTWTRRTAKISVALGKWGVVQGFPGQSPRQQMEPAFWRSARTTRFPRSSIRTGPAASCQIRRDLLYLGRGLASPPRR